ncbi:MAG: fused MFS/spermidine synthase [Elusimicrobia bacterium]|nr:fused MFS/spermidine synthase [Elusimicrobiota bacterium]
MATLCGALFLTGGAALVFEVLWARLLLLALGAGAQSLAVAAAGTMLGLAAGNELGGRLADRRGGGLRRFGELQLAAAAVGALVTMILRGAWDWPWPILLLLIALPNALMGAALPVLAPLVASSDKSLRSGIGGLYAANTAGAVAGTLAAGFWLIERLGLSASAWCAASVCAAVGILALWFGRDANERPAAASSTRGDPRALVGAGVSGFCVTALEVLDTRFLIHGFHATSHAFAIILACFIGGLALGAALCASRLRRAESAIEELGAVLVAGAALTLALAPGLVKAYAAGFLGGESPSWSVRLACESFVAAVLLLPSTVALGLAFPLAAGAYARRARPGTSTGRVFLVNTLCAAAGSLAAGFVLPSWLGLRGSLVCVVLLLCVAGAWLARRWAAWGVCLALAAFGAFWARPPAAGAPPGAGTMVPGHLAGREAGYRVLCYREGRLATTEAVEELGTGLRTLFIDGFVTAGESATSNYMALMGRLPMSLASKPERALVICLGGGATARAVAESANASIDIVDINPDVFACAPSFGAANVALLARARSFIEDGRRFLRRDGAPYDVISQEPMPPYFAGTAALYSVEYYRLAKRRLAEGGVMAQWLPLHLTAPRDARQIVAAALAVFPETWVALAPGGETAIVISSPSKLDSKRRKQAESKLKAEFLLDPGGARRYTGETDPVTDDRPALEYSGIDRVRYRFPTPEDLSAFNISEMRRAAQPGIHTP